MVTVCDDDGIEDAAESGDVFVVEVGDCAVGVVEEAEEDALPGDEGGIIKRRLIETESVGELGVVSEEIIGCGRD